MAAPNRNCLEDPDPFLVFLPKSTRVCIQNLVSSHKGGKLAKYDEEFLSEPLLATITVTSTTEEDMR